MTSRTNPPTTRVPGAAPAAALDPALAARVDALLDRGGRVVLGIAGAPGAGKSTLAAQVAAAYPGRAVVVPMDGFHLAQSELERIGRADRKGAPDTFDAAGFVALLRRLRDAPAGEVVYAPEYRRDLRNGVAGAIAVGPAVPLVVTEGNYLLLDAHGFGAVAGLLDEAWFVAPDDDVRLARLVARHEAFGKPADAARAWAHGPDERNARLVAGTAARADVVVRPR
ncbi:nucleoside/nucleotide kinase family protein [Cellulomonas fimi]|uniref:Putative fructose transport system kinase n=1 Tax=Cellulomonas fimi (strain ATCC 484 / DSM 20113 / JCM 1341 / CCUG 24087 / LMG 16345 / NBRC 15513 / NCIMB 8980 / NCTC 7547 / NRS-133) TaxID=590998 RepID=F4H219_CELFA|nr:nucleoside/nucleotide kinase family protein [Cellulomonas fimi]AEE45189.1 putative fructose transport system kinase [Cellulomonas fimi ATCC 484]VEH28512.1 nucleoside triphosphate hydrolase domain-containing protein [Cellulomonas fimi]